MPPDDFRASDHGEKGDDGKVLSVCDLSLLVSLFPVLWCKSRDLDMVGNHSLPELSPSP